MQSHQDKDFQLPEDLREATSMNHDAFIQRLKERAQAALKAEASMITGGAPGEEGVASWEHKGVHVVQRPDDEQGIVRVSLGGEVEGQNIDYCVFRGNLHRAQRLLRRALAAMEAAP